MKVASRELPYSECRVAVLDPKFAQESEAGLRSRQSSEGKDEKLHAKSSQLSSLVGRSAGG